MFGKHSANQSMLLVMSIPSPPSRRCTEFLFSGALRIDLMPVHVCRDRGPLRTCPLSPSPLTVKTNIRWKDANRLPILDVYQRNAVHPHRPSKLYE